MVGKEKKVSIFQKVINYFKKTFGGFKRVCLKN